MATQPPSTPDEPLTLDEVKLNLRVDTDADDSLIECLIVTAREQVENLTDLVLTPRALTETVAQLGRWVELASWPVIGIDEVRYPVNGVPTAFTASAWQASFKRRPVRILPTTPGWGVPGEYGLPFRTMLPVEIDIRAGYADPAAVPATLKHAMHLLIAHWYANRSAAEVGARAAAVEIPQGVQALLQRFQVKMI